eukprot:3543814-Rhodomonas_salina.1
MCIRDRQCCWQCCEHEALTVWFTMDTCVQSAAHTSVHSADPAGRSSHALKSAEQPGEDEGETSKGRGGQCAGRALSRVSGRRDAGSVLGGSVWEGDERWN